MPSYVSLPLRTLSKLCAACLASGFVMAILLLPACDNTIPPYPDSTTDQHATCAPASPTPPQPRRPKAPATSREPQAAYVPHHRLFTGNDGTPVVKFNGLWSVLAVALIGVDIFAPERARRKSREARPMVTTGFMDHS